MDGRDRENAKANTVSAPNAGAAPESGALKRTVSGNSSVTFSREGKTGCVAFQQKILLAFLASSCARLPALNRRAAAAVRSQWKENPGMAGAQKKE